MSFMLPCNTIKCSLPTVVKNVNHRHYTVDDVKEQIPAIRKKIKSLRKRLRTETNTDTKNKQLNNRIKQMSAKRRLIMSNLPVELRWLGQMHGEDVVGFESNLFKPNAIMIRKEAFVFKPSKIKCKCQATTLKGVRCSKNTTSENNRFCKMHS